MGVVFVIGVVVVVAILYYCCRGTCESLQRSSRSVPPLLPDLTNDDYEVEYRKLQVALADAFKIRCGDKVYIPFYSFHLKRMLFPCAAWMEFINNWVAFLLTITLLFSNSFAVAIVSFVSLMAGQLIVHFNYGYNSYSNPGKNFIAVADERFKEEISVSEANFEKTCQMFDYLYHGKSTQNNSDTCAISFSGLIFRFLNDAAVIGVCVAIFVAVMMAYCGSTFLAAHEATSNPHAENRNCAFILLLVLLLLASVVVELAFVASGTLGSIAGAAFWASLSIAGEVSDILPLVIVANVMLYLVEEYYTALLFNKSPEEYGSSILFNIFYDVISETEVFGSNLPGNVKSFVDVEEINETSKKSSDDSADNTTFDEDNMNDADEVNEASKTKSDDSAGDTTFDEEKTNDSHRHKEEP